MKKQIVYLIILITLLLVSCSNDDSVLNLKEYGTVTFKTEQFLSVSAKNDVPLCSNETPVKISFLFVDENGFNRFRESAVSITDNEITMTDEVRLPIGFYSVEDISLLTENGTVTHMVPNRNTEFFDFSTFTEVSTPFDIEVSALEETQMEGELLCYTSEILDLSNGVNGQFKITPLQTLYFQIPNGGCMNRIVIVSDGKEIIDFDVSGAGIRGTPIIKDFDLMEVIAYNGSEILDVVNYTVYNPDGNINLADVVQFNVNCN